jgi:sec-independent protein translocase protein TatC
MVMSMKTKKKQTSHRGTTLHNSPSSSATAAFIEHAQELRKRLYYIAASVLFWGVAVYAVQQKVVHALLKPAGGQKFIYTSPGGGIDFLFRISVYSALVISLPVIVYNALRFIEPLITKASIRFIIFGTIASSVLAIAGVVFGYFIGLPAALHFLLHQFTTVQIQPLVTIQSYLGFVIVYMVGSAMLFQLPLLLLFINRIKPLQPQKLLHYERWVILAAFVVAGLMNPSPNIVSQLLVAGPFIIMYQVGIVLIAVINRHQVSPVTAPNVAAKPVLVAQPVLQPLVTATAISASIPMAPVVELAKPRHSKPISDFVRTSAPMQPKLKLTASPQGAPQARTQLYTMRRVERTIHDMQPRNLRRPLPPLDSWRQTAI